MKTEILLNYEEIGYFAALCGIVSLLVFIIDFLIYKVQKKPSFLGIIYRSNNSFLLALLWILGAASVGIITHLIGILKINTQTVVAVGVSWPYVFSKIVKFTKNQLDEEDEQLEEEKNG
jgi:branched-subunit amino acid transport protein AzlD